MKNIQPECEWQMEEEVKVSTENNEFWCDSCPAVWVNTLTHWLSSTYFEPSKRFRNKRKITGEHRP